MVSVFKVKVIPQQPTKLSTKFFCQAVCTQNEKIQLICNTIRPNQIIIFHWQGESNPEATRYIPDRFRSHSDHPAANVLVQIRLTGGGYAQVAWRVAGVGVKQLAISLADSVRSHSDHAAVPLSRNLQYNQTGFGHHLALARWSLS